MEHAVFQYQCRLCGEKYKDVHTSKENAAMLLVCIVYGHEIPKKLIGMPPTFLGTHTGCKKGYGISDLIGYSIEEG